MRRQIVRTRLTADEEAALRALCGSSGLTQAEVLRRLILASAKRSVERAAAGEIELLAVDVAALSKRVEALHARLGGVESALMASLGQIAQLATLLECRLRAIIDLHPSHDVRERFAALWQAVQPQQQDPE